MTWLRVYFAVLAVTVAAACASPLRTPPLRVPNDAVVER